MCIVFGPFFHTYVHFDTIMRLKETKNKLNYNVGIENPKTQAKTNKKRKRIHKEGKDSCTCRAAGVNGRR